MLLFGLAVAVGPTYSQEYIDLDEERRQQERLLQDSRAPVAGVAATAPITSQTQNFGELLYQLQLLQQEVMTLRGQLEEQGHQLRQLKQQSLERYVDLDRRISAGGTAISAGDGNTPASNAGGSTAA